MNRYSEKINEQALFFFEEAEENFHKAASQVEIISRFYSIAGFSICLKFAGFVDCLTFALSHLEIKAQEKVDLTICIWDSVSTKTTPIQIPWKAHMCNFRGEVIGYNSDRIHTVLDVHTNVLCLFDRERDVGLYWLKSWENLPWWVAGSPFQLIFHWSFRQKRMQLTHAAVVGTSEGGVLLAGKSGSGKSTTTLSCMKRGLQYVSEDYCLLSDLPEIWAYSIYNSSKIDHKTLSWFPQFEEFIENKIRAKTEKAFFYHQIFQPEKILHKIQLRALVVLKVGSSVASNIERIDPMDAIGPLSISTMWQLTHTGPVVFQHLKRVTQTIPCYRLILGTDLNEAPELIKKLL